MLNIGLIFTAIAVLGLSGLPACLLPSRSVRGQQAATLLMLIGSITGLGGIVMSLCSEAAGSWCIPWALPWGQFMVTIDSLSLFFLAPVFVIPALGSIYGLGYWKPSEHPENSRRLGLFYGLLAGSMAMVVIARDGVLFLVAWEVMAIAAYFTATAEDTKPEVRQAGWVYLVATHAGTLCLIAMFVLWRHTTGSFALETADMMPRETAGVIFLLALVGFGFKAGLMPLHVWLPGAHANAPSHVSAVMSGVMLKMGIYGIIRMTALLPGLTWHWGGVVLGIGAVTGVAGIAFAIGQRDLKRVLAYSSIENIGIIAMGLGLALLGRSHSRPEWIILGLGGTLLHVWNHALFKSLLFFNAGAIIHTVHTRDIERMGGLSKQMPRLTVLFVVGAAAICALPPLNGFVSEWLIYVGLFKTLGSGSDQGFPAAALGAAALAMIGALAAACFVKLLGTVFLGQPRGERTNPPHDPPASMMVPMIISAALCAVIGLFPITTTGLLDKAVNTWASLPVPMTAAMSAPLTSITAMALVLCGLFGLVLLILKALPRAGVIHQAGTWDCGYARPTTRMQYTGSSFGQMLVNLFAVILWPKRYWRGIRGGAFPQAARFNLIVQDTILDRMVLPLFSLAGRYLPVIRILQQGRTHLYVLYILVTVIVLLICGAIGIQS
jgi:hydrogenase-4 component B